MKLTIEIDFNDSLSENVENNNEIREESDKEEEIMDIFEWFFIFLILNHKLKIELFKFR